MRQATKGAAGLAVIIGCERSSGPGRGLGCLQGVQETSANCQEGK